MQKFMINPLSANGQCHTIKQAADVFENLIAGIKYIWPIIKINRASLHYYPCDKIISLCSNEPFETTLNRLRSINGDLPRLWYMYTKNQPSLKSENIITIAISSFDPKIATTITGTAISEILTSDVKWLSFGGNEFNETTRYRVNIGNTNTIEVMNAHSEISLQPLLPFFNHYAKHQAQAYYDKDRNEHVAAMPIRNKKDAGNLLRIGIVHGKDIFSYHSASNKFYRFKLTGGNIYHGFEVEQKEVPIPLLASLKV